MYFEQDYQRIILIDAVNAKTAAIGQHFYLLPEEIIGFDGFLSSHNIGVSASLALAKALGRKIDHVVFYGIQGEVFHEKNQIISPKTMAEIIPLADELLNILLMS